MLSYALLFLVLALVAGALGFGIVTGHVALSAKIFFAVFVVMFTLALIRCRKA